MLEMKGTQCAWHIHMYICTYTCICAGPPAKPAKPVVSKVTGTSVKLKWSAPEEDGGSSITTYQVGGCIHTTFRLVTYIHIYTCRLNFMCRAGQHRVLSIPLLITCGGWLLPQVSISLYCICIYICMYAWHTLSSFPWSPAFVIQSCMKHTSWEL